jgi:zinc/manganese transport system substrate-binding protein
VRPRLPAARQPAHPRLPAPRRLHQRLLSQSAVLPLLLALALPLAAAHGGDGAPLRVVCANTILADIVHQLGGDRVSAISLVKPGVDPHSWEPTPADIGVIASARLVVVNGLGLEGWLEHAISSSGSTAAVVVASAAIAALPGGDGAAHGVDPHAWQDAGNGQRYARTIRDALIAADPAGGEDYAAWAEISRAARRGVVPCTWQQRAPLPVERRILVTSHDALGYFARAYGMEIRTVEGMAPGQEPDAAHIAELIALIRARHLRAVFIETMASAKVIERIGAEGGAVLGGRLYSDSLAGPGEQASTYIGMFLANTRTIVLALR